VVVVGRDASSSYDELLGSASAVPPPVFVPADADHVIVHTSGSSGQAKGVVHSGASWLAGGNELLAHLPTIDEDDALLVLPGVSHTSGLFVLPFLARGARCVLTPVLDPAAYLRLVELERCTVMPVWPELVELLSAVPEATTRDLSHVRAVIYGYRPLSARTVAMGTRLFGDVLFQFYGQAEAIPATVLTPRHHATRPSERERRILASAGRPTVNTDLTVREGDRVLPPGETGELCVQTPGTMRRIWGDPVGTAARFTPDGAVRTQDVGYLDEDGFLHVVDRREDLIVSSGQEVWPVEVERTLATHPDVREAAVVGVPDEELGEAVLAVVVLREGAVVSAEDLVAWAGERLDPVRAPGQVVVSQTPLPRHRTGKLLRGQIRARHDPGWSPAGR
jgi:acyl-coenzyme A synthetase/AMP-(fatty) acid ligase